MRVFGKVVLVALCFYFINQVFIENRAIYYINIERYDRLAIYLLSLVLVFGIIELLAFTRMKIRIPFLILFLAGSIPYLIYFYSTSTELTYEDFRTLFSAKAMVSDAAQSYQSDIIKVVLMHIPITIAILLMPQTYLNWKWTGFAIFLYCVGIAAMLHFIFHKNGRGTSGRASYLVPVAHAVTYGYLNRPGAEDRSFIYYPREILTENDLDAPISDTILFVIDESIRADMIDLNNPQGTTPALLEFDPAHYLNFGYTMSFGNCSESSNLAMRKAPRLGKEPSDLFLTKESIWEIAINAGYTPYLIDAQHNAKGHNFYTDEELKAVNVIPGSHLQSDGDIVPVIEEILQKEAGNKTFIYVSTKGSHFPFQNYGFEEHFTPAMKNTNFKSAEPIEVMNSYKNLIRANTNEFFNNIRPLLENRPNITMIYTSDHGQELKDPKGKKTHCDLRDTTLEEGIVPFLIFGDESILTAPLVEKTQQNSGIQTQMMVPSIIMNLMGYRDASIERYTEYSQLLNQESAVGFVYKSPVPQFRNDVERYPITREELEYFKTHGKSFERERASEYED